MDQDDDIDDEGSHQRLCITTMSLRKPVFLKIKQPNSENRYWTSRVLGGASGATVYRASFFQGVVKALPKFDTYVAIKVFNNLKQDDKIHQELRKSVFLGHHPNILEIYTTFHVGDSLYVVMAFMGGGSLQSIISAPFRFGLTEECVRIALKEILKGLSHIHHGGLLHKHIDARYIFLCPYAPAITLAFAASLYEQDTNFPNNSSMHLRSSSEPYCMRPAPEASVHYTIKANVWLVGITALQLCYGLEVFDDEYMESMIRSGKEFIPVHRPNFSGAFRDMVAICLDPDPSRRPEPEELLSHRFFDDCQDVPYFTNFVNPDQQQRPNV